MGSLLAITYILCSIIALNIFGKIYSKYSLGLTANSLIAVFGGVFLVKTVGRIFSKNDFGAIAISSNLLLSIFGAVFLLLIVNKITIKLNKKGD